MMEGEKIECMLIISRRRRRRRRQIIRTAVSGMLPKNKLRDRRLARLKVFAGEENPFAANIGRRYDVPAQTATSTAAGQGAVDAAKVQQLQHQGAATKA